MVYLMTSAVTVGHSTKSVEFVLVVRLTGELPQMQHKSMVHVKLASVQIAMEWFTHIQVAMHAMVMEPAFQRVGCVLVSNLTLARLVKTLTALMTAAARANAT
jgi:hypothetical protein